MDTIIDGTSPDPAIDVTVEEDGTGRTITIVFDGYNPDTDIYDYTSISGTLTITITGSETEMTMTMSGSGTLNYTGGEVSTITFDITMSGDMSGDPPSLTITGTATVDGTTFDMSGFNPFEETA